MGPDYFRTFGIALLAGREFRARDTEGTPKVAIVNEAFLQKINLGRDVIGKRLQRMGRSKGFDIEIVGVAANSAYGEVKEKPAPLVLMPYRQDPDLARAILCAHERGQSRNCWRRFRGWSGESIRAARGKTSDDEAQINENVALDRFVASMSAAFAGLATLLAALGL